ncbi:D-alanine--D-alanine ligase family protein [Chryseolinea sp. H1M3-3]|uniref:D-alanine--D-alanine ligase family protein n=1 Tax=Chryseolinea sp. H1M3-3 TaxID=3034144 RepID=UPI0023EAAC03|nr:D-alanine--D-alanine ligase family protein [Chryseolinea sp. H1M3-3]
MSNKKKVAILYGGRSVEHAVSVNSAKNIFEYIDKDQFEPVPMGISKSGQWFLTNGVSKDIEQGKALGLLLDPANPGFVLLSSGDRFKVDIIFPVLHGTDGEDGSVQGLIKTMDVPMVGTGVLGSALAMNKIVAKRLMRQAGLPVTDFVTFRYTEKNKITFTALSKKLGLPFMVKSASLGSSVGVTKVKNKTDFKKAIEDGFRYDEEILAEEFITGREIECAILGNNPPEASFPGEIVISKNYEFYTFDAKYVDPVAVQIHVPAKLTKAVADKIRGVSVKAYEVLHCQDFSRVDLFLTKKGKIFINEINTIPGFTNSSMYPMMWKERGVGFSDLITRLLNLAQERYDRSKRIEHDFQSALKF